MQPFLRGHSESSILPLFAPSAPVSGMLAHRGQAIKESSQNSRLPAPDFRDDRGPYL
jgi:hypothetical protein